MKKTTYFILLFLSIKVFSQDIEIYKKALSFIEFLKEERIKRSKLFHVVTNDYLLTDLDEDKIPEIIEVEFPEDLGYISIEVSNAFEYHTIYVYDDKLQKYSIAPNSKFKYYHLKRQYFYLVWHRFFSNPLSSKDLEAMVIGTKDSLLSYLDKLIERVKN